MIGTRGVREMRGMKEMTGMTGMTGMIRSRKPKRMIKIVTSPLLLKTKESLKKSKQNR